MLLMLGGCQTLRDLNPVNLYHGLEGGPIADARPPPPNADAPYPNINDTPDKPTDADAALRRQVASGLVADRANAQYEASVSPIPPPASSPPVSRGAPPPLKPDPDTPSASLAAANAPPAATPAAAAAPAALAPFGPSPGGASPAPAPAPAAAPPPAAPAAPKAAPVKPVASAPLPPAAPPASPPADPNALPGLPATPPGPPELAGAHVPRVTAPTPPPVPPPAPPPPPSAPAGATPIAFARGSSALPPDALAPLRALAKARGVGSIGVTGYGEAASPDTAAQAAAVPLGFARARAIAAQLEAAGVPATAIRLDAEAAGNGAAVRVLP